MIRIVTNKRWKQMLKDLDDVRGANVALHELMKGQYNKYSFELGKKEDTIKDLEAKLRKAEHRNNELTKKVRKYESRGE